MEPTLNKYLYLFFLLFCAIGFAQDSTVVVESKPASEKIIWNESDIVVDKDSIASLHFDPKFKSRYTDDAFVYEIKTREKNGWDRFKEWLSDLFERIFGISDRKASMSAVELVLKILAVCLILFVIYLIVKAIMNKDGQWIFGRNSDRSVIRYDDIERNLHLVDFAKLIAETLTKGERRLAIRYYYLWLLKRMSEREVIEWDPEKTNSDYLYEIKNQDLKARFEYLSYLYNYIWYGEFDIDEIAFEKAKSTFDKTIQSI